MKRLICCALLTLLTGCIPIGFQARTSSLSAPDAPLPSASVVGERSAVL
jgi:hypothetical protein